MIEYYTDKRRIERISKMYKLLDAEETDIISDYETEYGQPDHWNEKTEENFNTLINPVQIAKNEMWRLLKKLENGAI